MKALTLYFNPDCSKCRRAVELLEERSVDFELVEYLANPPSREALEGLVRRIGDARSILRVKDAPELDAEGAEDAEIVDWIVERPALLERPIAVSGDQAVVARPPERILDFVERTRD